MTIEKEKVITVFKKRLYSFVMKLIEFLDEPAGDVVSRRISDQLFRSGSSILSNYVEAQSASRKKEFNNFLMNSLKSANESKMCLALLRDSKRTNPQRVVWFLKELGEIS